MARWTPPRWRGRPATVWLLGALLGSLGASGVAGGTQLVLVPSGAVVGLSTAELAGSPFGSYLVPGVVLLTVLGVAPLVALVGLARGARWAWAATVGVGCALVVWVVVQALVIGVGERLQYPHLLQAAAILLLAGARSVRAYCGVA